LQTIAPATPNPIIPQGMIDVFLPLSLTPSFSWVKIGLVTPEPFQRFPTYHRNR
jgi:hypothetical protein